MDALALKEVLHQEPLHPFYLCLTDGKTSLAFPKDQPRPHWVDTTAIVRIEFAEQAA